MIRPALVLGLSMSTAFLLGACSNADKSGQGQAEILLSPSPNPFPDAPPNAPPPAATCGDMNGGGDQHVDFPALMETKIAEKPTAMMRQLELLEVRYDLEDRPSPDVSMTRGKPIQQGVRVRLPEGQTWAELATLTPEEIRERDAFPAGFFALPHHFSRCPIRSNRKAACCSRTS
jgi:hypothetical protein